MSEDRRKGQALQPGMVLLALVGVSLLGWAVANSPLFATRSIVVRGLHRLDPAQVKQLAGVQPGTNLLRVAVDRIAGSLERDPWIADAVVDRSLPSTLVITIAERRPVGWLRDADGRRTVLAADGVVLEQADERPATVPWLGHWPAALAPGDRLENLPPLVEVVRAFPDPVLPRLSSAGMVGDEVVLHLRGGGEVFYGSPDRVQEKGRALDSMLRWADQEGITVATVDVRIPESPTLRPVS